MARNVKISTVSFRPQIIPSTMEANTQQAIECIDIAAIEKPDLIVFPELFLRYGVDSSVDFAALAEGLDGVTIETFASKAKQYSSYIIVPIYTKRKGNCYVSLVLLDRKGHICSVYDKYVPGEKETQDGICAGEHPLAAETDFGKIGMVICFDINFDELRQIYKKQGVELFIFSSMFPGGMIARTWAFMNRCYLVSSTPHEHGSIFVNPLGKTIANSAPYEVILTRTINLDYKVIHLCKNHHKFNELKKVYGGQVQMDIAGDEGIALLSCIDKTLSTDKICDELGLVTDQDWFARGKKIRDDMLSKRRSAKG